MRHFDSPESEHTALGYQRVIDLGDQPVESLPVERDTASFYEVARGMLAGIAIGVVVGSVARWYMDHRRGYDG